MLHVLRWFALLVGTVASAALAAEPPAKPKEPAAKASHKPRVLAAYRAEHVAYPEKLADLSPRYVAAVPKDIFAADGPMHYSRQGQGYLLYSVGPNGCDDGGRGRNDDKDGSRGWDDLSVRVP